MFFSAAEAGCSMPKNDAPVFSSFLCVVKIFLLTEPQRKICRGHPPAGALWLGNELQDERCLECSRFAVRDDMVFERHVRGTVHCDNAEKLCGVVIDIQSPRVMRGLIDDEDVLMRAAILAEHNALKGSSLFECARPHRETRRSIEMQH